MYVVGKEVINSLRDGRDGDLVRAAYGAVAAAGAITWGVGYAPGQNVTAGNAGAVVHGVGSGFMDHPGPREQPRRSHQDTERGEVATTASSHRRSGATSRRHTSHSHTTSRDHTSRTTGRDEASAREPVSRRNGADRNRDNHGHRRGGGGASGGS